jgi:DDE family transposase
MQSVAVLEAKLGELLPLLDERSQRLVLGAEARAMGHGGIGMVARASGASRGRVSRGVADVAAGPAGAPGGRARRPGAGRRAAADADAGLLPALMALVEPGERGDPMSPLRWTTKSLRRLAGELARAGHRAGRDAVAGLLHREGFSLQGASRTLEGTRHPDRDGQFRYISELVAAFQRGGQPVISVDAKKKELVGDFHSAGREWRPAGDPARVRTHDFPDPAAGKVIPYGIYDLTRNTGWVSVGIDHDTAGFAVETVRRWWAGRGQADYPGARALLVTADAGGSNSYRTRAWKAGLGELARQAGLQIVVCHFPPGTSKWNKIEHRLFAHITMNWRGRPLTSHEVIVQTIAATTTRAGLTVHAELDPGTYPVGVKVTSDDMTILAITPHHWHGDWNYTLHPRLATPPDPPAAAARPAPADRAPAWLAHPTLTGHEPGEWNRLQARLTRRPAATLASRPSPNAGTRMMSPRDQLLATVLKLRWSAH